jgi:hypothetical protein
MTRWSGPKLRTELRELHVSPEQFCHITGMRLRTLQTYMYDERRMPSWMPFLVRSVSCFLHHHGDAK